MDIGHRESMREILLTVEKPYPNDSGRGIARLDPDTLLHLKLSPGDIIEVNGFTSTLAKTWRADREDWNTDTIRIDGFIRNNAGVRVGQRVKISKAEVEKADTLTLAPPPEANVQFGKDAAGMVKRQLLKRPISEWDIVPVMSSTNHPFMRSPGQAIPLVATQIDPGDSAVVTEDTDVLLTERIQLDDAGVINAVYPERPAQDPQFQVKLENQEVPSDKCGYQKISKPIVPEDEGNLCCTRQVWRGGLCVWHSEVDKSLEESEPAATTKPVDRSESRPGETDSIGRSSAPSFEDLSFQEAVLESRGDHAERLDAVQLNGAKIPENVSFNGCLIAVAQFQRAELTDVDFSDAKIWHSDFSEANLRDTIFEEAVFEYSHLDRAELVDSDLEETEFIATQLVETNLSGSRLRETVFEEAQAVESDFSEAIMRDATITDSNLMSSDFSGAELQSAKLRECNLSYVDFTDADLRGADFTSSDVAGAELSDANNLVSSGIAAARNLSEAEWAGANLHGIDFTRRDLSDAALEEVQLRDGILRGADLSNANLSNASSVWCKITVC